MDQVPDISTEYHHVINDQSTGHSTDQPLATDDFFMEGDVTTVAASGAAVVTSALKPKKRVQINPIVIVPQESPAAEKVVNCAHMFSFF